MISYNLHSDVLAFTAGKDDELITNVPGICSDCFQVGEEVASEFRNAGFDMDRIWSFRGPRNPGDISGGHHIDLTEACRLTLVENGVKNENISISGICTYERTDILYSARKEGPACGRNINAIGIIQVGKAFR